MRVLVSQFYARPGARLKLLTTSAVLCYAGGGAMFAFHCIYRGEHGPALSDWSHWLLDSSVGFVLLTPALALLLPINWWLVRRRPPGDRAEITMVAAAFSLLTFPGPLVHEKVVGAGTPLANLATGTFGENAAVAERMLNRNPPSLLGESLLQVAVGLPVYLVCTWLAFRAVRFFSPSLATRDTSLVGQAEPFLRFPPGTRPRSLLLHNFRPASPPKNWRLQVARRLHR